MHEDIGADGRHGLLEIQIIVADSVGLLGQAGQILADAGPVTVWGYQLGKALCHPKDMQGARQNREAHGRIPRFEALQRLNRDDHALGHQTLREFSPAASQCDILAQPCDCTLALGR